jgi:hypothetical protein
VQNTDLGVQEPFPVEAVHGHLVAFPQLAKFLAVLQQVVDQVVTSV